MKQAPRCEVRMCVLPRDHAGRHEARGMSWPRTDTPLSLPALGDYCRDRAETAPLSERATWTLLADDIAAYLTPTKEEPTLMDHMTAAVERARKNRNG